MRQLIVSKNCSHCKKRIVRCGPVSLHCALWRCATWLGSTLESAFLAYHQCDQDGVNNLWTCSLCPRPSQPPTINNVFACVAGEPLTVTSIGGSITQGQGVHNGLPWPYYLRNWIQETYKPSNFTFHNGAVGGTVSHYMATCHSLHVPRVVSPYFLHAEREEFLYTPALSLL